MPSHCVQRGGTVVMRNSARIEKGCRMPGLITHDCFGRGVIDDAARLVGFDSADERDAFLLGNQGPDPLFFLTAHPLMAKWVRLGSYMHDERPAALLLAMKEAAERLEGRERELARAYVAGFICHWQLDSLMHPLVYHWEYNLCDAGVPGLGADAGHQVHAEVERDFDEMVLHVLMGRTAKTFRPYEKILRASKAVLNAVDKVYFYAALWVYDLPIDPRTYSDGVHCNRLVQRVIRSATGCKRVAIGALERLLTRSSHSLLQALSLRNRVADTSDFDNREHHVWSNPRTGQTSTASFWDLYEQAQGQVLYTLAEVFSPEFDLAAAHKVTGDVNFEGGIAPDDKDLDC